jgi:amino acid adenylation domain-containing protein
VGGVLLHDALADAARRRPNHPAVEDLHGNALDYRTLDELSDRVRDRLVHWGVRIGDRVGFWLPKSIDGIATVFGILKAGAAYVPVDPGAPAWRGAYVLNDCEVKGVVCDRVFVAGLEAEFAKLGARPPRLLVLEETGGGRALEKALAAEQSVDPAPAARSERPDAGDPAYILYTSGSTGKPKGVTLSHRHAVAFVDWCMEALAPRDSDRFSSHAPLHFDLSILDIHVPIRQGATVVLFGEDVGKEPARLAPAIGVKRITIWYSTPSILTLLVQYGRLESVDASALRIVCFAGEVFAVKHLRALQKHWSHPRYLNLYGPTETNVCTWYEVEGRVPEDRTEPYPIGKPCSHCRTRVVDEEGLDVPRGEEGELVVAGPALLSKYWNLPEQTANAFFVDSGGERWYRTGDLVIEAEDGNYVFHGRRDRMVKRRGYRVELGEVEAGLYRHASVREAAAIALRDADGGVSIRAFVHCPEHTPSIIELKRHCSEVLPSYMIPDVITPSGPLPKTSTDKIDLQRLREIP